MEKSQKEMLKQSKDFEKAIEKSIAKLDAKIRRIISKLDIKDGKIVNNQLAKVLMIKKELKDALEKSGYYDLAEKTIKKNSELMETELSRLKKIAASVLHRLIKKQSILLIV